MRKLILALMVISPVAFAAEPPKTVQCISATTESYNNVKLGVTTTLVVQCTDGTVTIVEGKKKTVCKNGEKNEPVCVTLD